MEIEWLSKKGRGIASDGTEVIGSLPGEEVKGEPCGRKLAILREVVRPSKDRVEPRCSHSPACGGCSIQQLKIEKQLELKEGLVKDLFGQCRPIIGCRDPWRYRNKMEFTFSQDREGQKYLGLILGGSRGLVLDLKECFLVSEWFTETLSKVRDWWESTELAAYYHRNDRGALRNLVLREALQGTGKMIILTVSGNPHFALTKAEMSSFVKAVEGKGVSVFLRIHQIAKGRPTQFFEMLLSGPDHITEKMTVCGKELQFKISPASFFQPNTRQAERLYTEALSMVQGLDGGRVYDLYCGGATLGLSAASKAKEVVGIELNPHSVFDAGWNKEVNGYENVTIHQGDVGKVLETLGGDPPDVVIVDPPRAGLDEKAIKHLLELSPKEILYISCNPKTQKANTDELEAYELKVVQPVDQFPHTMHIENICLLERKG